MYLRKMLIIVCLSLLSFVQADDINPQQEAEQALAEVLQDYPELEYTVSVEEQDESDVNAKGLPAIPILIEAGKQTGMWLVRLWFRNKAKKKAVEKIIKCPKGDVACIKNKINAMFADLNTIDNLYISTVLMLKNWDDSKPIENPFEFSFKTSSEVYQLGEEMSFLAKSNKDCYLNIVDFSTNNEVDIILPNKYVSDNFLPAGKERKFSFEVVGEKGIERVLGICRTERTPVRLKKEYATAKGLNPISNTEAQEAIVRVSFEIK